MNKSTLKIFAVLSVASALCMALAACAPKNAIDYTVCYASGSSGYNDEKTYPSVILIRSESHLAQYSSDNGVNDVEFENGFFTENYVVAVEVGTSNSAVSYKVKYVQWADDNRLVVTLRREKLDSNMSGADVMSVYYSFIGISAEYEIADESGVTVNIVE